MDFRYFDKDDHQLTVEQMNAMSIRTAAMEHVFSSIKDRVLDDNSNKEPVEICSIK